jgi:DNA-binding response OmpR family regulator
MADVLLIEPDMLLAGSVRDYISSLGHSVQWRSSAQSAINSADKTAPDVVVLELQLADHSGIEFLYEFHSYPEWQNVPIIILSSLQDSEVASSSILLGQLEVVAYHHKQSTTLQQLGDTINQAIELKNK